MIGESEIKKQLFEINEQRSELEERLNQCKQRRDRIQEKQIKRDIKVLANRAKHLLFKLGKYRYEEDEAVEYSPGQIMPANLYHWLKD